MTTTPRERILYATTHEAAGLHDGRITLLVRPVRLPPCEFPYRYYGMLKDEHLFGEEDYPEEGTFPVRCPFGAPGDVLAVKEKHAFRLDFDPASDREKALHYLLLESQHGPSLEGEWHSYAWRPANRMPRWAIRTRVPILAVRVKRASEITEEEALKAGYTKAIYRDGRGVEPARYDMGCCYEKRHGEGSWGRDFVWLVTVGAKQ